MRYNDFLFVCFTFPVGSGQSHHMGLCFNSASVAATVWESSSAPDILVHLDLVCVVLESSFHHIAHFRKGSHHNVIDVI